MHANKMAVVGLFWYIQIVAPFSGKERRWPSCQAKPALSATLCRLL